MTPSDRVVNGVNVRERATSSSPAIHLLRPGDVVDYVATEGRWYEIRLEDGRLGFVSTSWTDRHRAEAAPPLTAREQDELRVHYLDVGNGTCTVIECPGTNAPPMVVDCGSVGGRGADDKTENEAREGSVANLTKACGGRAERGVAS